MAHDEIRRSMRSLEEAERAARAAAGRRTAGAEEDLFGNPDAHEAARSHRVTVLYHLYGLPG